MSVQPGTRCTLDVRSDGVGAEAWGSPTWEFEVREKKRGAESPDCLDENCGQLCEVMEVKRVDFLWSLLLEWIGLDRDDQTSLAVASEMPRFGEQAQVSPR